MEFRKVETKSQEEMNSEWDSLAPIRFQQIMSKSDHTFWQIFIPNIASLLEFAKTDHIVDVGCGVGVLTNFLSERFGDVVGLDPSPRSVEIARENFSGGAVFINTTLEDYAK